MQKLLKEMERQNKIYEIWIRTTRDYIFLLVAGSNFINTWSDFSRANREGYLFRLFWLYQSFSLRVEMIRPNNMVTSWLGYLEPLLYIAGFSWTAWTITEKCDERIFLKTLWLF